MEVDQTARASKSRWYRAEDSNLEYVLLYATVKIAGTVFGQDQTITRFTISLARHINGAAGQIRTADLILTKDALYLLSYSSILAPGSGARWGGDREGARTLDLQRDRLAF